MEKKEITTKKISNDTRSNRNWVEKIVEDISINRHGTFPKSYKNSNNETSTNVKREKGKNKCKKLKRVPGSTQKRHWPVAFSCLYNNFWYTSESKLPTLGPLPLLIRS